MSDVQAPPPPADTSPLDYSDDGPGIIAACSILLTLATLCVGLRFWSKRLGGAGWQLDDWLALAALVVHHAFMVNAFIMVIVGGLGRDIRLVATEDPNNIVVLFKCLLGAEVCYGFDSSLVKLSVLAFYWRIFPTKTVRYGAYILGSMCIMWTIAIQIVNFLQCRPLEAFWHIELQADPDTECLNTTYFFLWNSAINCAIDLATLTLPIRDVMRLHTTTSKKIGICAVFLLGSIAFAASLVRTVTTGIMYTDGNINFTQQFVVPGVTTIVEIYVAIIGACLPTMVPIYRKVRYGNARGTSAGYNSNGYNGGYSGGSSSRPTNKASKASISILNPTVNDGSFERLQGEDMPMTDFPPNYKVNVTSQGTSQPGHFGKTGVPAQGIVVRSDLDWSEQAGHRA